MTDKQVDDLKREIRISLRALTISMVASNLLSSWVPGDNKYSEGKTGIHNTRVMEAIYLARDIVYDAETSAVAKELK